MNKQEYEKYADSMLIIGLGLLLFNLFYYLYPILGTTVRDTLWLQDLFLKMRRGGIFDTPYRTKLYALIVFGGGCLMRTGKPSDTDIRMIMGQLAVGLLLYLFPTHVTLVYGLTTIAGFVMTSAALAELSRRMRGGLEELDEEDTFDQNRKLIETKYSVNLPMRFHWNHKWNDGWINIVNPFRMTLITGAPGSGKSYSVFEPAIRQSMRKGYCSFCYDFKFPALTKVIYNEWRDAIEQPGYEKKYGPKPTFHIVNFNDPRYSQRCNPIVAKYLTDPSDASEIAESVMLNINKAAIEKEDFFSMSAKLYLDSIIWFLKIYEDGKYCTFPHVIELMAADYKKVFKIMSNREELEAKIKAFVNAMDEGAQDQLQGQIASAQIPLNKFVSQKLYWVLSGNDVDLDINNPEHPSILCLGNDPDRQAIYGATSALLTSSLFKKINHEKKRHCAVFLDEVATIFIKGMDTLAATARSNLVALWLGVQTKAQFIRDYKKDESDVIEQNVGNFFMGATTGDAAKKASEMFGKEKRVQKSITEGESESTNISYREEERLPMTKIESLSQGTFCGKIADDKSSERITKKLFCGEIVRPWEEVKKERENWVDIPMFNDFGEADVRREMESQRRNIIAEALRDKAREQFRSEGGIIEDPERIDEILSTLVESTDKETGDRFFEEAVRKRMDKVVNDTIQENFKRIKREINDLVNKEYTRIMQEEKEQQDRETREKAREIARKAMSSSSTAAAS